MMSRVCRGCTVASLIWYVIASFVGAPQIALASPPSPHVTLIVISGLTLNNLNSTRNPILICMRDQGAVGLLSPGQEPRTYAEEHQNYVLFKGDDPGQSIPTDVEYSNIEYFGVSGSGLSKIHIDIGQADRYLGGCSLPHPTISLWFATRFRQGAKGMDGTALLPLLFMGRPFLLA